MPTETKLHKIAAKWEQMQKDRVEANPIDISNFIPSLDDMIKEDCVIDVLQNVAKDIKEHTGKDSPDDYKDVAYYSAEPYKTTPGYYPDARAFVLRVKDVEHGNKEWELNSTDGDTYNFKLSNLDNYKVNINNTRKCNVVPDKHDYLKVGIEPNIYNKRLNVKTITNEELLISNNIYENISLDIDDNYEVNINSTNNVNSELPSVTKVNINIK